MIGATTVGATVLRASASASPVDGVDANIEARINMGNVGSLEHRDALRLATVVFPGRVTGSIGVVLDGGHVIDVAASAQKIRLKLVFDSGSMLSLLAAGDDGMRQIQYLTGMAKRARIKPVPINSVIFQSPIPRPHSNIYCVGWNFLDHFEEGRNARADKAVTNYPEHPVFFTKGVHTMNHPFGAIPYETGFTDTADWEAELAVVIGRSGRNITEDQAMHYVFGYAAYNDTTVREVQQKRHGGQWFKGKSLDGYGPMGPWIITANGVDLDSVRIICRVNGVEKQNAGYPQMYFKIPRIIAELSRGLSLEPGDIIATGTPPGVGFARNPPEFLRPGDIMETEIRGVGSFTNVVKEISRENPEKSG